MIIEGSNLCLLYDRNSEEETCALKNVDILLRSPGITGVTGPSGSGKSSLIYLLSGLKKPSSGTVYYDNEDISALSPEQLENLRRSRFGLVFQKPFLIDYLNILDNVLVGCYNRDKGSEEKAMTIMDRLHMRKYALKKPYQLSMGQRQKIAVIRALMNDPDVIFADEPTACLDHRNAMDVMGMLEMFKSKAAILIVTHDPSILGNADELVELWDGSRIMHQEAL